MTKYRICDGYDESGTPATNCAETLISVVGPGGEVYCQAHENMAGSIVRRFDPPQQLQTNDDDA